jgi:hypothetical protein
MEAGSIASIGYMLEFILDIPWAVDLKVTFPITIIEQAGVPAGIKTTRERT